MKHFLSATLLASAIVIIPLSGCRKSEKETDRSESALLYRKTIALTSYFRDKIQAAPDTTDFNKIFAEFEDSLVKLNFSFPPDVDLLLTEGENDTIVQAIKSLTEARDSRLNAVGVADSAAYDSAIVLDPVKNAISD